MRRTNLLRVIVLIGVIGVSMLGCHHEPGHPHLQTNMDMGSADLSPDTGGDGATTSPTAPLLSGQLNRADGQWRVTLVWPRGTDHSFEVLQKSPADADYRVVATVDSADAQAKWSAKVVVERNSDAWAWKVRAISGPESDPWSPTLTPAFNQAASGTTTQQILLSCFSGDTLVLGVENGDVIADDVTLVRWLDLVPKASAFFGSEIHGFEVAAAGGPLPEGRYAVIGYRNGLVVIVGLGVLAGTIRYVADARQAGEDLIDASVLTIGSGHTLALVTTTTKTVRVYALAFSGMPANGTAALAPVATHQPTTGQIARVQLWRRTETNVRISYITDENKLWTGEFDPTSSVAWTLSARDVCSNLAAFRVDGKKVTTLCLGAARPELVVDDLNPPSATPERRAVPLAASIAPAYIFATDLQNANATPFASHDVLAFEGLTLSHWAPEVGTTYQLWQDNSDGGSVTLAVGFAGLDEDQMHIAVSVGKQFVRFDASPNWWLTL
jgi:hypothetical protein